MRAVLDTNVLLSGIAHPASVPGKLIAPWKRLALEGVPSSLGDFGNFSYHAYGLDEDVPVG
jgi:hypothetical protein